MMTNEFNRADNLCRIMTGIVTDIRYNHNMHQWDVIVYMEGSEYIWEPWNLSVIKEPGQ